MPVRATLQSRSNNVAPPSTPGKQVKKLQAELEKKDAENKVMKDTISELTNALDSLNLVKAKIDTTNANSGIVDNAPVPQAEDDDAATTTGKTVKTKKDKNAPVPAKTAYKFFCDNTLKVEGVDLRLKWKETEPELRQVFVMMAEADKARFLRENKVYEDEKLAMDMYKEKKKQEQAMEFYEAHLQAKAALEKAEENKKGKKKKTKDPEAPKRNLSSYMYFTMAKRESVVKAHPEASMAEITTILGAEWNKLEKGKGGKNGTKKYDELAVKDKNRYDEEKAVYDAMIAERNAQTEQEKLEYQKQEKEEAMELLKTAREREAEILNNAKEAASLAVGAANVENMSVVSDLTTEEKNKKTKKTKDPNAPKHPTSAYLYFCNENRASIKSKMVESTTQKELLTEIGRQWKELSDKKKEKYNKLATKDKERYAKEMKAYNAKK